MSSLADPLFWIGAGSWLMAFWLGNQAARLAPRVGPVPVQAILVSAAALSAIAAAFAVPLAVSGNIPIPCCSRFDAYTHGSILGIALNIVFRLVNSKRVT